MKSVKTRKSEHIQPLSSCTVFSQKQIARTVSIAKIFELTHSCSEDIFKIVNRVYAIFYDNLKQRNHIQINIFSCLDIYLQMVFTFAKNTLNISALERDKFI